MADATNKPKSFLAQAATVFPSSTPKELEDFLRQIETFSGTLRRTCGKVTIESKNANSADQVEIKVGWLAGDSTSPVGHMIFRTLYRNPLNPTEYMVQSAEKKSGQDPITQRQELMSLETLGTKILALVKEKTPPSYHMPIGRGVAEHKL